MAAYAAPNSHKKDVNCSFLSSLQWMVRGVTGPTGQHVPNPATRDNRRELAVVPIPHQLMAGRSVPDKLKRHRTVTFSHAQVPYVRLRYVTHNFCLSHAVIARFSVFHALIKVDIAPFFFKKPCVQFCSLLIMVLL